MMTKIGNMQKIMISLDIFAEEKSFLNWPENLPFFLDGRYLRHPVYIYIYIYIYIYTHIYIYIIIYIIYILI